MRQRELPDVAACIETNIDPAAAQFLGPIWPPDQERDHLSSQIRDDLGAGLSHWEIFRAGSDEMLGWVILAQKDVSPEPELGDLTAVLKP